MTEKDPSRRRHKFPQWYRRLLSSLRQFYLEGSMTDASLKCGGDGGGRGGAVKVHKPLLLAASPLVKSAARSLGAGDDEVLTILLPDFAPEVVSAFTREVLYSEAPSERTEGVADLCRALQLFESGPQVEEGAFLGVLGYPADAAERAKLLQSVGWKDDGGKEEESEEDEVGPGEDELRILRTEDGELLLVNCSTYNDEEVAAHRSQRVADTHDATAAGGRLLPCGQCGRDAADHGVAVEGDSADHGGGTLTHVYRCCSPRCGHRFFRSGRALASHTARPHERGGASPEEATTKSAPDEVACPICLKSRQQHRNRCGFRPS